MTDNETHKTAIRIALDWIAAILGIGTFAGLVNVGVGVLSGCWLTYQLYVSIKYDLPIKRAKLAAAQRGDLSTNPVELK